MTTVLADRVFDGERLVDEPLRITLDGGSIASVEPLTSPVCAPGEQVIDARGATVLPGLINTHVHIARGGMFGTTEPISPRQVAMNLGATLASGVTTIGEMGCSAPLAAALRELGRRAPTAAPSILAAGPLVTAPGGYPLDWMPRVYAKLGVALACGDGVQAGRAVERVARAGMDQVKLAVMHRSYADEPLPAIDVPTAREVVRQAHASGLRVMAHAHSVDDYRVALAAGADALMHSSFEPLDDETVARVRDAGVPVCPTLWVFESVCLGAEEGWWRDPRYGAAVTGGVRREWRRFCEAWAASGDVVPPGIAGGLSKERAREGVRVAAANLRLLRDAGVPIAFGNDAAYAFSVHARPWDELHAMRRAGMDAGAVLRAATSGAAALLGRSDRGRIAPGLRADLLVVDGDPLEDLGALERVRTVLAGGRRIASRRIERVRNGARAATATVRGVAGTVAAAFGG